MDNYTAMMEFCLMEFADSRELQVLHGSLFLLIYLATLLGNLLIIILVSVDPALHTPMYFFLKQLSFFDLCLISIIVPKTILNSLSGRSSISLLGCVMQVFLVIHFATSEASLLTVMSYDRYVAICQPLHYDVIMSTAVCVGLVVVSWCLGGIFGGLYAGGTFSLSFCTSRRLPQFFCDVPSLLKISCYQEHIVIDVSVAAGVLYGFLCLLAIVASYVYIFNTVLSMPSVQGRSKAFSTCLPHLVVVSTFLLTGAIAYLKPVPESSSLPDLLLSMLYSVLPPCLNPLIYSLRNKDIQAALTKFLWKMDGRVME